MVGKGDADHGQRPPGGAAIDGVTAQVLGVEAFLDQCQPRSEAAMAIWRQLPRQSFLDGDARHRAVARQRELDRQAPPALIEALAADFGRLPTLDRLRRRLDAGETLTEGDLFELKRFLFYALSLLEKAAGVDELPRIDGPRANQLRTLMETIHPERAPSARFLLADELDDKLAQRRQELRKTRRRIKQRRSLVEAEILSAYEGRFDFHGRFRPAPQQVEENGSIDDRRLADRGDYYEVLDPPLRQLQEDLDELQEQVVAQEQLQRRRLTAIVSQYHGPLTQIKALLVAFELRLTAVELRRHLGGCWAEVITGDQGALAFSQGREPALVAALEPGELQPIDLAITSPATVILGPNMGGKSALLRLIGLCQWCAQMALPVPAGECRFAEVERIVYVGSDEPGHSAEDPGLSAFGREVRRFVDFWDRRGRTLWLLDEPGRGTHPEEGARLAADIATDRLDRGDRVVMATHFPLLAADARFMRLRIAGLTVDDDLLEAVLTKADKDLVGLQRALRSVMDYRVVEAQDGQIPRDARRVARALGLPVGPEQ